MFIYADVLLFVNWVMNALILFLTGWITGITYRWNRILFSSLLGAVYVLVGIFPNYTVYHTPVCKFIMSCFLTFLAFGKQRIRNFFFLVAVFYLISFFLGGAVLGWLYFWEEHNVYNFKDILKDISIVQLIAGTLVGVIMLIVLGKRLYAKLERNHLIYTLKVNYANHSVSLPAILDTGNRLCTPLGRKPVIIVEVQCLLPLFNSKVNSILKGSNIDEIFSQLHTVDDESFSSRIQLIPYNTVGKHSILLAFRPESIEIKNSRQQITTEDSVIAFYNKQLTSDGSYKALLNPLVLHSLNKPLSN